MYGIVMAANPIADANLIVQTAAIIILMLSVMHVKKKNFPAHFKYTKIAASFLAISFLWMGYSFINNIQVFILHLTTPGSLIAVAHAVIGIPALAAGLSFALGRFIEKTLIPMRITFLLWTLAFFLGIVLYIIYYLL